MQGQLTVMPLLQAEANNNQPVPVDIVTVADKKTLGEVSKMTAQEWFAQKSDYIRMHPGRVHASSWEWVPGEAVAAVHVENTKVAEGVVLFANYASKGPHAAVLPDSGVVRINFGPDTFTLAPSAK